MRQENTRKQIVSYNIVFVVLLTFASALMAADEEYQAPNPYATNAFKAENQNATWDAGLRKHYYKEQAISEAGDVVRLEAPVRAENGAVVPIKILSQFPQTQERYIKTITLLIDDNPVPLAGTFHFTPRSGQADLDLRVRMNNYSSIRAIAETNDGQLHMARSFVKASGGCSAPLGSSIGEEAMSRLGKMKFRAKPAEGAGKVLNRPMQTQLAISHPNITGMQMDRITVRFLPAHYVKEIKVSFNGEPIFWAETDISISENPNFKFFFVPQEEGELIAEITDSNGLQFSQVHKVGPDSEVDRIADKLNVDQSKDKI